VRPQLLPECAPLAHFYLHCESQWRIGFAGREGLLYSECRIVYESVARRLKLPPWARTLEALQQIERSTLEVQDESRAARDAERERADAWPR
jgi:hypothetical protein